MRERVGSLPDFSPPAIGFVGLLGRGGMGEVYRADDLRLSVSVALKFVPPQRSADARWRRRLHGEVRIAREVAHRHVCRVHDIVDQGDEAFIAMEYVDGENLASLRSWRCSWWERLPPAPPGPPRTAARPSHAAPPRRPR